MMSVKLNRINNILICIVLCAIFVISFSIQPSFAASRPSKVSGVSVSSRTSNSITIKWKKVKRISKYQVAYKISGGNWHYKKLSSKYRTKKITSLKPYKKYYFKVRAIRSGRKGKWSTTKNTYTCPTSYDWPQLPLVQSLSASHVGLGSVTLSWEIDKPEVSGAATNYSNYTLRVYKSTDNSNWTLVVGSLSPTARSYTCRKCDNGVKYYFKVVPADTYTYKTFLHKGNASNILEETTKTIPGLKFKKTYTTRNAIYKENRSYTVKGLMVHSVGEPVQSAQTWVDRYNKKNYDRAAVHAFVDGYDGTVYRCLPWTMRGGHAGKIANSQYVGVEMCESKYIKYKSGTTFKILNKTEAKKCASLTYESTVKLFAYLCDYFGINPTGKFYTKNDKGKKVEVYTIMSHNAWRLKGNPGHYDPEHYWNGLGLSYSMKTFRSDVASALKKYN